jgi:hypothetical protein
MAKVSGKDVTDAMMTSGVVLAGGAVMSQVPQLAGILPEFSVYGITLNAFAGGTVGLLVKEMLR